MAKKKTAPKKSTALVRKGAPVPAITKLATEIRTLIEAARRQHVELLLQHGPHKLKVAECLTRLPDKRLLEERLKMYGRLLKDQKS